MLNISLHKNGLLRSVIDKTAAGKLQACVNGKSEPFESLKQLIPFVQTLHLRWICKTSAKFHDNCCQVYWKQNGKIEDAMEKRHRDRGRAFFLINSVTISEWRHFSNSLNAVIWTVYSRSLKKNELIFRRSMRVYSYVCIMVAEMGHR